MTRAAQLTLDGRAVPYPPPKLRPLTPCQKDLMRVLDYQGSLRSVEAGVTAHKHRLSHGGHCGPVRGAKAIACCVWANSDGLSAMRRLEDRGLVRRVHAGVWVRA